MEFRRNAEAMASILHKLSQLPEAQTQPSIYKVHKHLRSINDKAYEPDIIAIGPYHHGKHSLKIMEERKLRYLELLLQRKPNVTVETYISAVGEMEQEARSCYAEPISFNAAKFVEMLVLDGCFIIELTRKSKRKTDPSCKNDPIFQMDWIMNSLQRDLMLFENQIPFSVLCKLYELITAPNQHNELIHCLLLFFHQSLYPEAVGWTNGNPKRVKHLLDLIHINWHRPPVHEETVVFGIYFCLKRICHSLIASCIPTCLTSHDDVFGFIHSSGETSRDDVSDFIHSATKLTDANVQFQVTKSNDTLFDVDFKKGIILMPRLTVDDTTECFFRNLIAYEQYFPHDRPTFVTDYVTLLDCLINSSRDVEILSQCGIIDNWLGSNEVVANIFNQLVDSVMLSRERSAYVQIFGRINSHYKKRWNRMIAVLNRDYFNSPWAYVSFFAAFVLLLLTVAQTVLSVLQVV